MRDMVRTRSVEGKFRTAYVTVKLPEGLTRRIDELIKDSEGDFTSRTDVIKYAVRLLLHQDAMLVGKDNKKRSG